MLCVRQEIPRFVKVSYFKFSVRKLLIGVLFKHTHRSYLNTEIISGHFAQRDINEGGSFGGESSRRNSPFWLCVLAQDPEGTAALQTAAESKGTRINSAGHGKRSIIKHVKWQQG